MNDKSEGGDAPPIATLDLVLESAEFYDAMQRYRHALVREQVEVVAAFEAVKSLLRAALARRSGD